MHKAPSDFFAEVQQNLHQIGQPTSLTIDERDIVDDYEQQEFGAAECAKAIAQKRL